MKKAIVIGGTSGIGLSLTKNLLKRGYDEVVVVGKAIPSIKNITFDERVKFIIANLLCNDLSFLNEVTDEFDTLIITCGFGRVALFENLLGPEIQNLIKINFSVIVEIIARLYNRIKNKKDFYTLVMGSICGHVASPLFSVYGSSKFGLCSFVENINVELKAAGYTNRILDVSPGSLQGTQFSGGETDLCFLSSLTNEMLDNMFLKKELFIPSYNCIYKDVIKRYELDHIKFGIESYSYKINSGRVSKKPQLIVGYLSGTFDLFHVGHLKILKRAKQCCDYLIVGVHESGAWKGKETFIPFNERMEIVKSIKYVDEVHKSPGEDSDAWNLYHYDKLFVGDDYKGSKRFSKYEAFFKDKDVEIVYFPYTKGISSTQLREKLNKR